MKLFITVFLLIFGNAFLANAQTGVYSQKIQDKIQEADTKIICETEKPRRVGTTLYKKEGKNWLIRIFTKDGEELEIWYNKNIKSFFSALSGYSPDDVYYYKPDSGWIKKDHLSKEEAEKLDSRIKFSSEEIEFMKTCAEKGG